MHVLYLSLEFADPIFSGNGVYSRSLVRSLSALGATFVIISGAPVDYVATKEDHAVGIPVIRCQNEGWQESVQNIRASSKSIVLAVPLSLWGRLDRQSAWEEYAESSRPIIDFVLSLTPSPDIICGVDWTSRRSVRYARLCCKLPAAFFNFRLFCAQNCSDDDRVFYSNEEGDFVRQADATIALCTSDARALGKLSEERGGLDGHVHVALPPLRSEVVEALLREHFDYLQGQQDPIMPRCRRYFTCCVRISREKAPHLFVDIVELLADRLSEIGVVPLLAGASGDAEYAAMLKVRLRACAPDAIIIDDFVGPSDLVALLRQTRLNFHPCKYDAYGMTIVEAAACGAPSLLWTGGLVGATELLEPSKGLAIEYDFEATSLQVTADYVLGLLRNSEKLNEVGAQAQSQALEWTEQANGSHVLSILKDTVAQYGSRSIN